jgi:La-related protein 7
MDKKYVSGSENIDGDVGNKGQHESNKKFRMRKKQMYFKLLNMMEFYFSPSNLNKDRFIAKLLEEDQCKCQTIKLR